MTDHRTLSPTRHPHLPLAATLLVVALATLGCGASSAESSGILSGARTTEGTHEAGPSEGRPEVPPPADDAGQAGDVDPFADDQPAINRLDPDLLDAVQAAARDMQDDGLTMTVTSGWRSREHQQRLYDEAVQKYGSEEEARRYVATPDASAHTTGDAVDIGPTDALSWLSQHGDRYGLCQTFANEMWHYELATEPGGDCPEMLPDGSSRG